MNRHSRAVLGFAACAAMMQPAAAVDASRGEELHGEHCVSCHSSLMQGNPDALYTRSDRRVTTREGLTKQVRFCELNLGLQWFDEEIEDVAAYLNQTFYKF